MLLMLPLALIFSSYHCSLMATIFMYFCVDYLFWSYSYVYEWMMSVIFCLILIWVKSHNRIWLLCYYLSYYYSTFILTLLSCGHYCYYYFVNIFIFIFPFMSNSSSSSSMSMITAHYYVSIPYYCLLFFMSIYPINLV